MAKFKQHHVEKDGDWSEFEYSWDSGVAFARAIEERILGK